MTQLFDAMQLYIDATSVKRQQTCPTVRSGHGVPQSELGGESSENHFLIPLGPKETGLRLEYLDTHGQVDSLALVPS